MRKDTPILITGAGGFIGKNLMAALKAEGYTDLMPFERDDTPETLAAYAARAGFVFHLAGAPRTPANFTPATPASPTRCWNCWPRRKPPPRCW